MSISRRGFLNSAVASAAAAAPGKEHAVQLNGYQIAKRHLIVHDQPTPDFFEGMLLGNGDIGLCVTVRPDALGLHLGKEDSWDIRVSEDHYRQVLPFPELLRLWDRASEEARRQGEPDMIFLERRIDFLREYTEKVDSSYRKPWPRPWPCGIVWIHWDSRMIRVARQTLDPSNGLLTLRLEFDDLRGALRQFDVFCFVNWTTGHVAVWTNDTAPFLSVSYYPNLDDEARLPPPEIDATGGTQFAEFFCYQRFPATLSTPGSPAPPESGKDRNFALCGRLAGIWTVEGLRESQEQLKQRGIGASDTYTRYDQRPRTFLRSAKKQAFRLDVTLFTPRDNQDNVAHTRRESVRLSGIDIRRLQQESESGWKQFWSRSAVEFADKELEQIWYSNQYFLACCLREGKICPGLFGNWASGHIGVAWHGDYHMNYNTQQVFWGVFSSNHVEQHLPYVELCESLLPMSESYAKEKLGMPGAFFPHSAYPVPSQVVPYPAPPWGYEVCETPWTVQSLWWHYLYTQDKAFLQRVYPLLRAATRFLVAYMRKEQDGRFHIVPTVSPENWGFTADQRLNKDCIIDLALSEFLIDATTQASRLLQVDEREREKWAEVRAKLAPYPKAEGPFGEVWLDVQNAPTEHVYNVPVTLAPVFPGEQVGIGLREQYLGIARRTAKVIRLEGADDLVYQPLVLARLGVLRLDWFKREVRYCLLPNGVAQDRARQIGGRFNDATNYDTWMRMGIWTENLALPAVLNECLLQSYSGTIRLFPNTIHLGPARFRNLRAVGAFLVSAEWDGQVVARVTVFSEKGRPVRLVSPWGKAEVRVYRSRGNRPTVVEQEDSVVTFETEAGEEYRVG